MVTRSLAPNNQSLLPQLWVIKYKSIDENLCGIDLGLDCRMRKPLMINLRRTIRTNMTLSTEKHGEEKSWRALILVLPQQQPIPKVDRKILVIACSLALQHTLKCLSSRNVKISEMRRFPEYPLGRSRVESKHKQQRTVWRYLFYFFLNTASPISQRTDLTQPPQH